MSELKLARTKPNFTRVPNHIKLVDYPIAFIGGSSGVLLINEICKFAPTINLESLAVPLIAFFASIAYPFVVRKGYPKSFIVTERKDRR